jgi:hypothetical protein
MVTDKLNEKYLSRSLDFISSARLICEHRKPGWLAPACLLVGTACELLAKKQLLEKGVPNDDLKRRPYGHDLQALWKIQTSLYKEAQDISEKLTNSDAFPSTFELQTHFDALAHGYGQGSDYSLRYHGGVRTFADPSCLGQIVEEIARRERMRVQS